MMKKGFTLIEITITLAIMAMIVFAVGNFTYDVLSLNSSATQSLTAQLEVRKVMKSIIAELRTASPSATGAFTIESAATNTMVFFADLDSDNRSERIRYFVDLPTKSLRRGVVIPTGNPPSYGLASETLSTMVSNLVTTTTPVFDYYDTNYAGTTSPLVLPIDVSLVRLIKVTVFVDKDPNRLPDALVLSSEVTLRNLKDNL